MPSKPHNADTICGLARWYFLPFAGVAIFFCQSRLAFAAWHENFESETITWRAAKADVAHRVLAHRRDFHVMHGGHAAECIQIEAGDGTNVYFAHDVPPARIVAELIPSIWIKADRPGIQLAARVVLPHTIDSRTGQPMVTDIRGAEYSQPGRWQQLRITDTPLLLNRRVIDLRTLHRPQGDRRDAVDPREAYIDQVWLNVYSGAGVTTTYIDDLEVAGLVPRTQPAQQAAAIGNGTGGNVALANGSISAAGEQKITLSGTILYLDGRPFFPRLIQSQGEPLAWLKELGFNAVRIPTPPTQQMLDEARQLGMWLISPPPESIWQNADDTSGATGKRSLPVSSGANVANQNPLADPHGQTSLARATPEIGPQFDRVLAWHIGSGLTAADLPRVAETAKQLRAADRRVNRPIVCDPRENLLDYSSHAQILSVQRSPLGSDLELLDYGSWLKERPRLARPGKPFWTTVQTEPLPAIVAQAAALGGPGAAVPTIDADSLRLAVYQAFAAGVRGIEFASSSRLDAADNTTKIRALSLALLNLELELLEPWGAAGGIPSPIFSRDPHLRGVVISTDQNRAKLVVAMRCPKSSQYVAQPAPMQVAGASFTVRGVPESHPVYEITLAGVQPIRKEIVVGGTAIAIKDFPLTALAMVTDDAETLDTMTKRVRTITPRAVQLQRELAIAMLAETEAVQRRLVAQPQLPPADVSFAAARTALARADQLITARDYGSAYFAARNAAVTPARWRREVWNRTATSLGPTIASPLATSFATLPDHINFAAWVAKLPLTENLLVGGEFEDLQAMMQAGWRNFEHPQPQVKTTVELSPQAPLADRFCLRLEALPADAKAPPALVESSPLWVTTAPVQLDAGDVVCIRGQVRVTGKVSGSVDGLTIIDSLGGEALAEHIDETKDWREFVLYRAATQRGPATVTFALTGIGEASLDNISIRLVRRGNGQPVSQQAQTLPPGLAPRRY